MTYTYYMMLNLQNKDINYMAKQLTELQSKFMYYLFNDAEGDLKKAKELAGYSKTTSISEIVDPLKDEIIEATKTYIASNGVKAMFKLENVLDRPNQLGASNIINAAKEILDRGGVHKKTEDTHTIKFDGVIILPAKGSAPLLDKGNQLPIIDIEPNVQGTESNVVQIDKVPLESNSIDKDNESP